ncbi:MAG: hypothetical protein ACRD0N_04215 [Acidimicrobiales bacterium]
MPDLHAILAEERLTLERLFYRLLEAEVRESRARVDERRRTAEEAEGRS